MGGHLAKQKLGSTASGRLANYLAKRKIKYFFGWPSGQQERKKLPNIRLAKWPTKKKKSSDFAGPSWPTQLFGNPHVTGTVCMYASNSDTNCIDPTKSGIPELMFPGLSRISDHIFYLIFQFDTNETENIRIYFDTNKLNVFFSCLISMLVSASSKGRKFGSRITKVKAKKVLQ